MGFAFRRMRSANKYKAPRPLYQHQPVSAPESYGTQQGNGNGTQRHKDLLERRGELFLLLACFVVVPSCVTDCVMKVLWTRFLCLFNMATATGLT